LTIVRGICVSRVGKLSFGYRCLDSRERVGECERRSFRSGLCIRGRGSCRFNTGTRCLCTLLRSDPQYGKILQPYPLDPHGCQVRWQGQRKVMERILLVASVTGSTRVTRCTKKDYTTNLGRTYAGCVCPRCRHTRLLFRIQIWQGSATASEYSRQLRHKSTR